MAIREGSRRWLLRLSWAGLIASLSLWLGLCLGRPLYYTDGVEPLRADELQNEGMLRWSAPEVVAELPGKVTGRVATLPDGRLCYGSLQDDGTSDLVVFDPRRPQVAPEPAYGLNTAHNELAPALAPDGTFYFASDRPGGFGGYDLFVSRWERGGFAAPVPLAAVNTARDETDPAPSPDGGTLVFVRIDREPRGPDDGRLFVYALGGELAAAPLFDEPVGSRQQRRADRDPAFGADGGELWFVRKALGEPAQLLRVSRHRGQWDRVRPAAAHWGLGPVRGPEPSADGLRVFVLQPGHGEGASALWYVSTASEVHPFWIGQRWLEWLLLGAALTCLLLLVLLHLGRRWTALDLLVQCLLLSLLLHVLLFLWLMGVEITGALLPGQDDGGGLQVSIVSAASGGDAGGGDDGQVQQDLSAMVRFEGRKNTIAAAAPGAELVMASAASAVVGPAATLPEPTTAGDAARAAPGAEVQDRAEVAPMRAGQANADAVAAATLPAVTAAASSASADAAVRAHAAGDDAAATLRVDAPGAALSAVSAGVSADLAAPAAARSVPEPRRVRVAAAEVADAGTALPVLRAEASDPGAAALPVTAAALPSTGPAVATLPQLSARDAAHSQGAAEAPPLVVAQPASALRGPSAASGAGPGAALPAPPTPVASASVRGPIALRDTATGTAPTVGAPDVAPSPGVAIVRAELSKLQAPDATALGKSGVLRSAVDREVGAPLPAPNLLTRAGARPGLEGPIAAAAPAPRAAATTRPMPTLRDAAPGAGASPGERRASEVPPGAASVASRPLPVLDGPAVAELAPPRRPTMDRLGIAGEVAPPKPGSLLERVALEPFVVVAELRAQSAYSNRFGPAKTAALEQFGGNADTERAVRDGLRYLASIQNRDGSWGDRRRYDDKYGLVYVGKSALCVLAFLGAGHTPDSNTEHSQVVARAIAHLLSLQDPDNGAFGPSSCYGHGIATYAIAECFGLTKDPALRRPLENALVWLLAHQGPRKDRKNRGGWGYFSPGLQAEDTYARISVSAWMVMALESARLSGIELPENCLPMAREYLELSFDEPNGWFRYNQNPSRLRSQWPTLPASTPAGAFCLMLLGVDKDDPRVATAVDYTVQRRPQRFRKYRDDDFVLNGQGNVYFWYYGSLACFLRGGEAWERWNERLKTVLPAGQAEDGSFPPIDTYADYAGDSERDRSYTTAMCVLSLEVYYRYFTPLLVGR